MPSIIRIQDIAAHNDRIPPWAMNTIADESNLCAICGGQLVSKKIDYIDQHGGNLVVIRDVPVRECVENGHQFLHASSAKKIEQLLELDRERALIPTETLTVPVIEFDVKV